MGDSNLDFLIFNPNKRIAIVGEAKGSVNDPGSVVDQTRTRIKRAKENLDYINTKYLNSDTSNMEYVLGVSWVDATELMKAILRKNERIIIWQVGIELKDEAIRLSVIIPPKTVGGTHESTRHMDNTLNKALAGVFLQSHLVAILLVLTVVDKGKPDGLFDFEDLLSLVRGELDYLDEELVREETRRIIQLGQWIGFVGEDKGKYYIRTRSRKADAREAELKNAWIEWQIKRDEEKEIEPLLIPIQNKYVEERKKRPRITEF